MNHIMNESGRKEYRIQCLRNGLFCFRMNEERKRVVTKEGGGDGDCIMI